MPTPPRERPGVDAAPPIVVTPETRVQQRAASANNRMLAIWNHRRARRLAGMPFRLLTQVPDPVSGHWIGWLGRIYVVNTRTLVEAKRWLETFEVFYATVSRVGYTAVVDALEAIPSPEDRTGDLTTG
jgi:hypothetical protein